MRRIRRDFLSKRYSEEQTKFRSEKTTSSSPLSSVRRLDVIRLAFWRVLFGFCFAKHIFEIHRQDLFGAFFWFSGFNFKYSYFEWVQPLQMEYLRLLLFLMMLACLSFIVGFLYRFCSIILLLSYGYIFLLEKAWYVNHHYLHLIFLFLFMCTDCHRMLSVDSFLEKKIWRTQKRNQCTEDSIAFFHCGI